MHGWTIVVGLLGVVGVILLGRSGERNDRTARCVLAFLCLAAFAYTQAAWLTLDGDPDLDSGLPLHLCDLSAIIAGFALISRKPLLMVLTYFWGLAATVQALATPAISIGFPHPAYIAFFVQHFAIVAAALYLPIVMDWRADRPWWRGPWTAIRWINVYLVMAMVVNVWLGTNFGFTARKPVNPSLLDQLGPWPLYLIWMEVLAAGLFSLLALPVLKRNKD